MHVKIKQIEKHQDSQRTHLVARGKLLLHQLPGNEMGNLILNNKVYNTYIISEVERTEKGEISLHYNRFSKSIDYCETVGFPKILSLPENFSPKHIQAIVDGKLRNGDEVFVECEEVIYISSTQNPVSVLLPSQWDDTVHKFIQIKLNQYNYIKLFKVDQNQKDIWSKEDIESIKYRFDNKIFELNENIKFDSKYFNGANKDKLSYAIEVVEEVRDLILNDLSNLPQSKPKPTELEIEDAAKLSADLHFESGSSQWIGGFKSAIKWYKQQLKG